MGINKEIVSRKTQVMWNGDVAVTVKGLTPNDIARVLRYAGEDIAGVVGIADDLDGLKASVSGQTGDAVAEILVKQVPRILESAGTHLPELLARLIAIGAEDEDEWEFVLKEFNVGLQFECLKAIADLSFNGPEGFRMFVGNALALLDTGRTLSSATPPPVRGQKSSACGSRTSSRAPSN